MSIRLGLFLQENTRQRNILTSWGMANEAQAEPLLHLLSLGFKGPCLCCPLVYLWAVPHQMPQGQHSHLRRRPTGGPANRLSHRDRSFVAGAWPCVPIPPFSVPVGPLPCSLMSNLCSLSKKTRLIGSWALGHHKVFILKRDPHSWVFRSSRPVPHFPALSLTLKCLHVK